MMKFGQITLMLFCPATGESQPYPSHAAQWREYHGKDAWLFNPWSGARRNAGDVGTDPFGRLILPPGEVIGAVRGEAMAEPKSDVERSCRTCRWHVKDWCEKPIAGQCIPRTYDLWEHKR